MSIIEQIKAEIDKRYTEYSKKMKTNDFTYYEGMADALDLFEQFIDTLESEKPIPKDLEEAAEHYASVTDPEAHGIDFIREIFIAGAEWQEEKDQETIKLAEDHAFLAGADWQKEKMLKEALEGQVRKDGTIGYFEFSNEQQFHSLLEQFQDCDKVRIIIVKDK